MINRLFILLIGMAFVGCGTDEVNSDNIKIDNQMENIVDNIIDNKLAPSYITEITKYSDKETIEKVQDDYGDYVTVFEIEIPLRQIELSLWILDDVTEHGGKVWGVKNNGDKIVLFNESKHGYNGQLGLFFGILVDEGAITDKIKIINLESYSDSAKIVMVHCYSDETFEYGWKEGNSPNPADYFDWIVIYIKNNNKLEKLFEYECS